MPAKEVVDRLEIPPANRVPAEWPLLAGVRFLLALAIANYHLFVVRAPQRVPFLGELGSMGCICGFLAISGYSIAHSISKQPKGYFLRRAWRIMPIYYATMALAIAPYWFSSGLPPFRIRLANFTLTELLGSLFLLQCFVTPKIPVFGPSWTLAIEWWFYVTAPLLVRARAWMLSLLVGISLVVLYEGLAHGLNPIHEQLYGLPSMMLMWAWISGFLFYRARGWTWVVVIVAGFWATTRFREGAISYVIASSSVVLAKTLPPIPKRLAGVLNYLGDLSYPLYLVHVPLMFWLGRWTPWHNAYAYIGISLLLAAALYHLVDVPLRGRFSRRPARIEASPVPPTESALPTTTTS